MSDDDLTWFIVQLHPYAVKTKRTEELVREARKRLGDPLAQMYYGVIEDDVRKYGGPYEEYLFIEWFDGIDASALRDDEFFSGALMDQSGHLSTVSQQQLERIRQQVLEVPLYREGDWVVVTAGSLLNYEGRVEAWVPGDVEGSAQVIVDVCLGETNETACLPYRWVRKKRRKKRA